jgi:hypothetical protein
MFKEREEALSEASEGMLDREYVVNAGRSCSLVFCSRLVDVVHDSMEVTLSGDSMKG